MLIFNPSKFSEIQKGYFNTQKKGYKIYILKVGTLLHPTYTDPKDQFDFDILGLIIQVQKTFQFF